MERGSVAGTGGWAGASSLLWRDGWLFLVPYFILYLVALGLGLTNGELRAAFWLLHGANAALLLVHARACVGQTGARRLFGGVTLWFWLGLAAFFLLPGAYLEFPGDPWEHVRRLNAWPPDLPVRSSPFAWRFAYFWNSTFLLLGGADHGRVVLDLLSGFWQWLLAYQLYAFARRLGFSETWARIQVIGAVALFGNGEFGFFRYYALSSTPLAYVAYLRAAMSVLDLLDRRGDRSGPVLTIAACAALVVLDHPQELVFLALLGMCAGVVRTWEETPRPRRKVVLGVGTAVFLAGLAVGRWVMLDPVAHGIDPYRFYYPFVSRFATLRLWDPRLDYFRTLGLAGLAGLIFVGPLRRRHPLLAATTLAPPILLSFPPFALVFSQATSIRNSYRLLYLVPVSFMLVAGLQLLLERWPWRGRRTWAAPLAVSLIVLALGLRPWSPTYGKLPFQLFRPPPALTARSVDPVASWFRENRTLDRTCIVTSDPVSEWVVAAWLGREPGVERVSGYRWLSPTRFEPWIIRGTGDLLHYRSTHAVCGFLVQRSGSTSGTGPVRSWVGESSGHWAPDAASIAARTPLGFAAAAEGLLEHGWRKTPVPPSYWYYEPPAE